jgi:hypothetical protein
MHHVVQAGFCAVLLVVVAASVRAQSMADLERAEAALEVAWAATPIQTRTAVLVTAPPQGFGIYGPHPTSTFAPGESIVAYAEPVGFGYREAGPGLWQFGFDVDLLVKTADGQILGGQEGFEQLVMTSRTRNREFMLTLTLELSGAAPGDYVVEYTLHDLASGKVGKFSLPFAIAAH